MYFDNGIAHMGCKNQDGQIARENPINEATNSRLTSWRSGSPRPLGAGQFPTCRFEPAAKPGSTQPELMRAALARIPQISRSWQL